MEQTATIRQMRYLDSLGVKYDSASLTIKGASDLIKSALKSKPQETKKEKVILTDEELAKKYNFGRTEDSYDGPSSMWYGNNSAHYIPNKEIAARLKKAVKDEFGVNILCSSKLFGYTGSVDATIKGTSDEILAHYDELKARHPEDGLFPRWLNSDEHNFINARLSDYCENYRMGYFENSRYLVGDETLKLFYETVLFNYGVGYYLNNFYARIEDFCKKFMASYNHDHKSGYDDDYIDCRFFGHNNIEVTGERDSWATTESKNRFDALKYAKDEEDVVSALNEIAKGLKQ